MRFYIETYGCTSNQGNSREAKAALIQMGHVPASPREADALIVNTCAVTEKTERKMVKRLRQLQGDRLIIAGCLPAALPGSTDQIMCCKKIGLLNRSSARKIAQAFPAALSSSLGSDVSAPDNLCGIINIAEGCRGRCSYCIVKKARGELVSQKLERIVDEALSMISQGYVELQLAAQDTAAYGLDIGSSLSELLAKITEISGNFKVRIGMMNPSTARPILHDLVEVFRMPKVYKFLHMPVQSGSNNILDRMCRDYRAEDCAKIVGALREKLPDLSFATDVIAGFPGETEEDFAKTVRLIELTRPDKVNITRYSPRPQTGACQLYDMPDRIKKERSRRLTRLWLEISRENNRRYLGEIVQVLVTERGRGSSMKARTNNYTGVVIFGAPALGILLEARIVGYSSVYLTGEEAFSVPASIAPGKGPGI